MAEEQVVEQAVTQETKDAPQQTEQQVAAESNAAFEGGFNKQRGVETPKTEAKVDTPAKEEPKVEVKVAPDKWAGVPETVKAEFDSITKKLETVDKQSDRLRNIEGQIGGISLQLKTALATAKTVETKGGDAPTQAQVQDAAKSGERWKRLKEDFPDWADAVDERLAALPKSEVDVTSLKKDVTTDINKAVADAKAEWQRELIEDKHEGWVATVNTDEFKAWLPKQTPEIQALAKSDKTKDAVRLLDSYAESRKKDKANKDQRLKSAMPAKGVAAAAQPTINDDEAFERGFKTGRGG